MAERASPPPSPVPVPPSAKGRCGKCKACVILEEPSAGTARRKKLLTRLVVYIDGTITCSKCSKVFHVNCLTTRPDRLPFVCPACSVPAAMAAEVAFDPVEDLGGQRESESDEDEREDIPLRDDEEEFVPDEAETEDEEDEVEEAACGGHTVGQAGAVAHDGDVGGNVEPNRTASPKRTASPIAPTGQQPHAKRQKVSTTASHPASTRESTTAADQDQPREERQQTPAQGGDEMANAEFAALAKAVKAFAKPPLIDELKAVYDVYAPGGLPARSAAFLAEKCQQKGFPLALTQPSTPPRDSEQPKHKIGPGSRPRWKREEDEIIRSYVDLPCEEVEAHFEDFQKKVAELRKTMRMPKREFVQFKRRLYKYRVPRG